MNIHVFSSEQDQRGAEGSAPRSCSGAWGHSPCRVSYCLIWTSSTQSAGNQPVRPFTVPSQKPPSPMLSTGGTEARQLSGHCRTPRDHPTHHRRLGVCPPPPSQLLLVPSLPSFSWLFPGKILGSTQQTETNRWTQHRRGMWRTETHTDEHTRGGHQAGAGPQAPRSWLLSSHLLKQPHPCSVAHPRGHCQKLRVIVRWPRG